MISIVLPTYNGEKYIRESLNSILSQTFTDWELIIVNDCSTDGTEKIIKEYVAKDKRIKSIHNEKNLKLPTSLNVGFSHANGEFLTWTSDDNIYLPNALSMMNDYLQKNSDCAMVVADMEHIDENGELIGGKTSYNDSEIYFSNSVGACFLYRRKVLNDVGKYDPKQLYVEDYDYWLRIKTFYGLIAHISQTLYHYRIHSASLTATKSEEIYRNYLRLISKYFAIAASTSEKNKRFIFDMYMQNKKNKIFLDSIERQNWVKALPALNYEIPSINNCDLILFGAGGFGEKVGKIYSKNLLAYIDNDEKKLNKMLNNVPVLNLKSAMHKFPGTIIMITVQYKYIYDIMNQLFEAEVKKFAIYQNIV